MLKPRFCRFLGIFWWFFGCVNHPSIHWHRFFGKWKVLWWYISRPNSMYVWLVVCKFLKFKCFIGSRKYDFRLFQGGFWLQLAKMLSNWLAIFTSAAMQSNSSNIWQFLFYSKQMIKIGPKTDFSGSFWQVFHLCLLIPQFSHKMEGPMKIYNPGEFCLYSVCGSQVVNFQMFSWWCSINETAPFWGFLGPFSPKYDSMLLEFWPEVVYHKKKTALEQSFKIMC